MKRLLLLVFVLLLAACNWLPNDLPLLRIDPAALASDRMAEQRLQLVWRDKARTMESVLDLSGGSLRFIGSAMGLRLFSLNYDGERIEENGGVGLPSALPPERIINDMLLIYAPEASLLAALPDGWTLEVQRDRRLLRHDEELVIEVVYHAAAPWLGRTVLRHLLYSYQLTVDSADVP